MILNLVYLLVGLALVLIGAEALVEGASSIARKWGVSEFVIGMTIVAFGTSAPEMVVSFISSLQGKADMAVGNIVGSNIFNTAFILGLTALICPVFVTDSNKKVDIPINLMVCVILIIFGLSIPFIGIDTTTLSRIEGAVFLLLFGAYLWYSFTHNTPDEEEENAKTLNIFAAILITAAGLAGLIFGGKLFVNNAEALAKQFGLSEKFIGITILALGTSLPELATSLVAAVKGKSQMALGNILGSNVFNVLLILGSAAVIRPLDMNGINAVDFSALLVCGIVVLVGALLSKKKQLRFGTGSALLLVGIAYMTYLFINL
ncbi:MAG: calcium/sodium antiporter [Bacteroidales bacterium]|nr:calcium/sodium antiporter [Candidatus Cryptobacteroides caccocaballi]